MESERRSGRTVKKPDFFIPPATNSAGIVRQVSDAEESEAEVVPKTRGKGKAARAKAEESDNEESDYEENKATTKRVTKATRAPVLKVVSGSLFGRGSGLYFILLPSDSYMFVYYR